jgi:magnesium-transporting ATPase (P-type)
MAQLLQFCGVVFEGIHPVRSESTGACVHGKASALRTGMFVVILILSILLLLGALPAWPSSSGWGNGSKGLLGLLLIVIIVFALLGRL